MLAHKARYIVNINSYFFKNRGLNIRLVIATYMSNFPRKKNSYCFVNWETTVVRTFPTHPLQSGCEPTHCSFHVTILTIQNPVEIWNWFPAILTLWLHETLSKSHRTSLGIRKVFLHLRISLFTFIEASIYFQ